MLKAFNDQSENEIIDWESFSRFTNSEIIDYINAICILEETSIEDIILEFKNVDSDILTHENINLFEVIDTTLMTDKFLNKLLPQGDRSSEEDHGSRRVDHYDPIPYRIVAKRIFVEEIKPSRAYFLLLEGVKKGIKDLDFDTIIAYETSQLFEIRRNDKSLTTNKDLKELMSYDTSYERFSQLINQDEFLEQYYQVVNQLILLTEDDRVYQNHYLPHLKAYLDHKHDLEYLQILANQMCMSTMFLDPIDG